MVMLLLVQFSKFVFFVQEDENLDIVGVVCMDVYGYFCVGVFSGGVVYKIFGRIGQVSFYLLFCYDCVG